MLRLVHHYPLPARPTPRILGIHDWAWRKGQCYGTILVDLLTKSVKEELPLYT